MKVISFSAVEILPSLLDKTKTQTIRPIHGNPNISHSRYGVGDIVQLMWKQRTSPKDSWFCSECGNRMNRDTIIDCWHMTCECLSAGMRTWTGEMVASGIPRSVIFPKIFGTVKISEIFQIEIGLPVNDGYGFKFNVHGKNKSGFNGNIDELAEKDGFKCVKDMADWFDKNYDISKQPKMFEVRRWVWQ